jgi:hypothetical protein
MAHLRTRISARSSDKTQLPLLEWYRAFAGYMQA